MAHEPSHDPENTRPTVDVRGGETGHNVRYVLAFSLLGIVVLFGALLFALS